MAGNSIGSIGWDLFANTVGFESDLGRAARITQRETERIRSTISKTLGALGVGISVVGITNWVGGALKAQDAADELGQKLGITTEAASRLSAQAKFTATDAEGMGKAFLKLNQNAVAAAAGVADQATSFRALGVDVKDANGHVKSADDLVLDLADKFSQYRESAEKTAAAQKLFGKSGADMIPYLNMGRDGIKELNATIEDLGLLVTSKTGLAAARFADSLDTLGLVSSGVANQIAGALAPALADLADKAVAFFRSDDWKSTLATIRDGTQWVVDNIGTLGRAVKLVGELFVLKLGMDATRAVVGLGGEFVKAAKKAYELAAASTAAGGSTRDGFMAGVNSVGKFNAALGAVGVAIAGWQIGRYLATEFRIVADAGDYLVYGIAQGWARLKQTTGTLWAGIKLVAVGAIDAITETFATMLRSIASAADVKLFGKSLLGNTSAEINALATSISGALTPMADFTAETATLNAEFAEASVKNKAMKDDMQAATAAQFAAKESTKGAADAVAALGGMAKGTAPAIAGLAEKQADAAKRAKELAAANRDAADMLSKLRAAASPMAQVYEDEAAAVRELFQKKREWIAAGMDEISAQRTLRQALALTSEQYDVQRKAVIERQDVSGRALRELDEEIKLLGMSTKARRVEEQMIRLRSEALQEGTKYSTEEWAALERGIASKYRDIDAINAQRAAADDWLRKMQDIASGAGDAFGSWVGRGLKDTKGFLRDVRDSFADTFKKIISDWASSGLMRIFSSFMGGGTSGGGFNLGSLFGAATGGGSAPLGSSANAAGGMDVSSLLGMGSTIWKGFSGAASAFGGAGGIFSGANWAQAGSSMMGGFTSAFPGVASMLGLGGGAAAFTGAGSLAYGSGATAVGFGGTFGGGTAAYGAGAGASAGGGSAMTGLLANPVTWILAGMAASAKFYGEGWRNETGSATDNIGGKLGAVTMGMDKLLQGLGMSGKWAAILSGSSLHTRIFGRKDPVVQSSAMDFNFADSGATGGMVAQIKEKGGWLRSDKRYSKEAALDEETKAAMEAIFEGFRASIKSAALALGIDAPAMVASSIKQNFDKSGKLVDTIVTVLGRSWKESMEEGIVRIGAENIIAAVGVSAGEASEIAEQWRSSAAKLAEGAQFLLLTQSDINAGNDLLRDPAAKEIGSGSLAATTRLIQELQAEGATLAETYAKAVGATAQLDMATALMGINLGKGREDVVRFAVGIADAAGGLDVAGSLWTNYINRFHTDVERAQFQFDQAMKEAGTAFGAIGLSLADYQGEGGAAAFREMFEKTLPTLSAEATVQWLKAAEALGIVIDTSAILAQAVGTTGGAIAQTAEQLKAIGDVLDGYAWERLGAGMTTAERAARDMDRQYQEQVRLFEQNAATLEQRNKLEKEYADAVDRMNAGFKKQRDEILAGNDWELSLVGMTDSERQIAEVNKRFDDQIKTLKDLGATQADLDRIEKQRGITLGNLTAATLAEQAAQAAQVAAAQAQAARDYDTFANSIRGMGVELTQYQREMQDANNWHMETVEKLNELAISAGRSGANLDDLNAAEVELDRRRGIAIQNLMDQSQALVKSLYGTINSREIERLEKSLEGRDGFMGPSASLLDFSYFADQKKLAELRKQEEEANARMERMTGVNQLVGNLGQLLNIPGQSLETLAKQFELPLDSLAADLGLSADELEKYVKDQAARANAMVTLNDTVKSSIGISNDLLRQIRDGLTGDVDASAEKMAAPDRAAKTAPVVEIAAAREEKREKERRDDAARIEKLTATVEALLEVIADNTGITADRLVNLTDQMRNSKFAAGRQS